MSNPSTQRRRPTHTAAEQRLLLRFRDGHHGAFQTLVQPHLAALLALARRLTGDPHWAEDLVQETLVRAFQGRGRFRGEASIRSWLFKIQVRLATEPARWQKRERLSAPTAAEVPDQLAPLPEQATLSRELRDRLAEAMERLTFRQRTALHLRAVEGLDYGEIAKVLGGSRAASRMLVLAARQKVLARMGRYLAP